MTDLSRRIAEQFRDPRALCAALGIDRGAKRLSRGALLINCVNHQEKTPSLQVSIGNDGIVYAFCHGCRWSSGPVGLVAAARGIDVKSQYRLALEQACELGGLHSELAELRGESGPSEPREPRPTPEIPIARAYPPQDELLEFWRVCLGVTWDNAATGLLRARGLDEAAVERADLLRVIPDSGLPAWATYHGRSWLETAHRMVVPVYDSDGHMRSVRAWQVPLFDHAGKRIPNDSPKRLPPAGFRASELVLANQLGIKMLQGEPTGSRILILEGESDFVTRSMLNPEWPVIAVYSGSWTESFAKRIPYGSELIVRTHRDRAGDGYALKVLESVRGRAQVYRLTIEQENAA